MNFDQIVNTHNLVDCKTVKSVAKWCLKDKDSQNLLFLSFFITNLLKFITNLLLFIKQRFLLLSLNRRFLWNLLRFWSWSRLFLQKDWFQPIFLPVFFYLTCLQKQDKSGRDQLQKYQKNVEVDFKLPNLSSKRRQDRMRNWDKNRTDKKKTFVGEKLMLLKLTQLKQVCHICWT